MSPTVESYRTSCPHLDVSHACSPQRLYCLVPAKRVFQVALQGPRVSDYMSGVSRVIQLRIFAGGGLLVVSVLSHRTRRIARPASEFSLQLLAFPAASTPAGRSFPDHNPSSAKKTNQKRPFPATFVRMPLPPERCGSL